VGEVGIHFTSRVAQLGGEVSFPKVVSVQNYWFMGQECLISTFSKMHYKLKTVFNKNDKYDNNCGHLHDN
jgi:hypothetical protein